MKNNKKYIFILEIVLALYALIYHTVIMHTASLRVAAEYINFFFWIIVLIALLIKFRFPRDESYLKKPTIRIVIIGLFALLIIVYSLGLFLGYSRSIFSRNLITMFKNILPVVVILVSQEIIRYIVSKNTWDNRKYIVFLTMIYIVFNILTEFNYSRLENNELVFIFICGPCLRIIATQLIYSYITYKVSVLPTIILRGALEIYPYIFPFYPNLGDYIDSIVNIAFPFFLYKSISKMVIYKEKVNKKVRKINTYVLFSPVLLFLAIIIVLVSGLFRYKMIAIGSNSMVPVYHRGDTVIYDQINKQDVRRRVREGDILVFNRNGTIMTHRVVRMEYTNGKLVYITKGDANKKEDAFTTETDKVLGVVKLRIKYIGYPTLWITEKIFERFK